MDTLILKEMETHGKQPHISFFGFSGTPKNKTLEIFGRKNEVDEFIPFDLYSMKQSISEQFTLDVLNNYTTYKRYFRLNQETTDDSEVDTRRVKRMLVNWVDIHPHTRLRRRPRSSSITSNRRRSIRWREKQGEWS